MLLFSCMHVEKAYRFLLLCVPCQEITQDCTQSLLRNHLNYLLKNKKHSRFRLNDHFRALYH